MGELAIGVTVFACLTGAAVGCLLLHERLPPSQREERTHSVVRLAVGMIVVMASLVLGLLITSVKSSYDGVNRNVHAFATQLVLFDRALRLYGPEAEGTRRLLLAYAQQALDGTWPPKGQPANVEDAEAGRMLGAVGRSLEAIKPTDAQQSALWNAALQRLLSVVELRWTLIGETEATIPTPLLVILVAWLALIFASFAYNAPRNTMVVVTLLLCTTTIAAAVYLIVEMDTPFSGEIQISSEPVIRALDYMRRP